MIEIDDRGFTLGDGLFETVLAEGGALIDWDAHMARLAEGCRTLGLPAPAGDVLAARVRAVLGEAGLGKARAAVRLSWSAGQGGRGLDRPEPVCPRLTVTAAPVPIAEGPVSLVTASVRRNPSSPASRCKTLSYIDPVIARREARAAGAGEALMLSTDGDVASAAAANLFWRAEGVWKTPALTCGILAGTARARVLAGARAAGVGILEVREPRAVLDSAEAMFLTNSLIGARAVSVLDGRELPQQPEQAMLATFLGRR